MELAFTRLVHCTDWPLPLSVTALRPDASPDSVPSAQVPASSVPLNVPASASYSSQGTLAPRPTNSVRLNALLVSLVSATTLVASAAAVTVVFPFTAVQVPGMATFTVAPAAIAPVVPLSVVVPATTRVTVFADTLAVPRLLTATVKLTACPAVGVAGLGVTLRICRSGPGTCWMVNASESVLFASLDSAMVLPLSTVASTVCAPEVPVNAVVAVTVPVPPAGIEALEVPLATCAPSTWNDTA